MAFTTTSLPLRALALAGALLLAAAPAVAKTDIGGCVSTATTNQWGEASMLWYVPGTGEVCELLDCGGGRAPPKTNVPGCDNYKGTAEYQPTFLPGFGSTTSGAEATATPAGSASASDTAGPDESASPKPTGDMDTTMLTGTRTPPPVTSPATTATTAATPSGTGTSTHAVASSGGASSSSDAADSDAASSTTSPSAGAGAMPTAAPLGMFIGLIAGAVLF